MITLRHVMMGAALVALTACVRSDVLILDPGVRPETDPDAIQLLAKEPDRPYVVVGLVSASSGSFGADALRKRLQHEAARLGGDALLFDSESLSTTHKGAAQLSAKVIVFQPPGVSRPPLRQLLL